MLMLLKEKLMIILKRLKMTKFQALFVLWLRHEKFYGCSWRALAWHYYNRYAITGKILDYNSRDHEDRVFTPGGNQITGIELEREAFKILIPDPLFREPYDLYECDLTRINANVKNHIK